MQALQAARLAMIVLVRGFQARQTLQNLQEHPVSADLLILLTFFGCFIYTPVPTTYMASDQIYQGEIGVCFHWQPDMLLVHPERDSLRA